MFILTQQNSVANQFLAEIRDVNIHKDGMRFRKNLERIGEILAYEISKTLSYTDIEVQTPLGVKQTKTLKSSPVLVSILRAGMPLHQGFTNYFDHAESAFIGAFRGIHEVGTDFEIEMEYISSPNITDKTLIICDPMLATGKSLVKSYKAMLRFGKPKSTHIVGVIASKIGLEFVKNNIPEANLWIGDLDDELNDKAYIVPGLGDAGDLAYGVKL